MKFKHKKTKSKIKISKVESGIIFGILAALLYIKLKE